jgi:predicted DNA binding protein
MSGLRAELSIDDLARCPVATASATTPDPIGGVNRASAGDETVEQFVASEDPATDDCEEVFAYDDSAVYEFTRDADEPCFCETVERHLGPVADVQARDGTLHVTVHATDVASLRDLLSRLSDRFGAVSLEYLVRTGEGDGETPVVPVALGQLTARQREVIRTAHDMGYFEYPRDSNATAVSAALDIEPSTFSEHLAAAQGKLMDQLLDRS